MFVLAGLVNFFAARFASPLPFTSPLHLSSPSHVTREPETRDSSIHRSRFQYWFNCLHTSYSHSCRSQLARQPLGLSTPLQVPPGSVPARRVLRWSGVCGCTPVRAFRCQKKQKVLHSSHFLALRRLFFHEECDSLVTYITRHSSTSAIRLKLILSSSLANMLRITSRHLLDRTSSFVAS